MICSPTELRTSSRCRSAVLETRTGATVFDISVFVTPDPEYQLPLAVSAPPLRTENQTTTALREAEDSVTEMLAEGFVLGKDLQGAETAVLLLGSTIVDLSVSITRDSEYQLPPAAATPPPEPYQVGMAEDEQKRKMIDDFAQIHLSASLAEGYEPEEQHSSKPVPAKGLIL